MILSDVGKIATQCWEEIPKHFPNAILHEYVIMPNHVHGIIELVGAQHVRRKKTHFTKSSRVQSVQLFVVLKQALQ